MNLNYHTSETDILAFVAGADQELDTHAIAIDFDGEVIIDPEKHFPHVPTSKYKFCTHVRDISLHSRDMVSALYFALRTIFFEEDQAETENGQMNIAA